MIKVCVSIHSCLHSSIEHLVFIYVDDNNINVKWQMEKNIKTSQTRNRAYIGLYMYAHAGLT